MILIRCYLVSKICFKSYRNSMELNYEMHPDAQKVGNHGTALNFFCLSDWLRILQKNVDDFASGTNLMEPFRITNLYFYPLDFYNYS